MFIKHPTETSVINISKYFEIKPCSINLTHVDFYSEEPRDGERGDPDFTVTFETQKERDDWFKYFSASFATAIPSGASCVLA